MRTLAKFNNNRGQILLEYVLLVIIALTVANLIHSQLAGLDSDDIDKNGALRKYWYKISATIGADDPNHPSQ